MVGFPPIPREFYWLVWKEPHNFEQKACKYTSIKIGFPFYTADLRINVRCLLVHSKCIPRTKKDVFKNCNEIISAENVSVILFILFLISS